jgi:hypothetical protein
MKKITQKLSPAIEKFLVSPWHFLIFSAYFVFRLYDSNIQDAPFRDFVRPLLVSVLVALILFLFFGLLTRRRWHAAALMTTTLLFGFYLYATFWSVAEATRWFKQPETFAVLWGSLFILLVAWIGWKTPAKPDQSLLVGVNAVAIFLFLYPAIGILVYVLAFQVPFHSQVDHAVPAHPVESRPEIYYIILDAYARTDVLAEEYGLDNRAFIQSLKDLGFYVAECSQSNYESTPPSLTSSLNMDYLQNMSGTFNVNQKDLMDLFKLMDDNAVQETVSNFGYKTVNFASGFHLAEWHDADIFIAPPYGPMSEFETLLLQSTYARLLDDRDIVNFDEIKAERYRARTRLVLDSFDDVVRIPGPKFVFIHLIIPHAPFAFDPDGNPVAPDKVDGMTGYANQIQYISKAIIPRLKLLIEESSTPPVIILQGDHGPYLPPNYAAQLKNLNAYYLPEGSKALYPSITPVNSFRVVFNQYFDAGLPLLEDNSYYSRHERRFEFLPMPPTCPGQ